jgi:hypothetical protein
VSPDPSRPPKTARKYDEEKGEYLQREFTDLATAVSDLTTKLIESDESLTVSTTKPLGTSEEIRMPVLMVLIPPLENRNIASEYHRM